MWTFKDFKDLKVLLGVTVRATGVHALCWTGWVQSGQDTDWINVTAEPRYFVCEYSLYAIVWGLTLWCSPIIKLTEPRVQWITLGVRRRRLNYPREQKPSYLFIFTRWAGSLSWRGCTDSFNFSACCGVGSSPLWHNNGLDAARRKQLGGLQQIAEVRPTSLNFGVIQKWQANKTDHKNNPAPFIQPALF